MSRRWLVPMVGLASLAVAWLSPTAVTASTGQAPATVSPASAYTAVTPVRVLDTRSGTGAPKARLGPGGSLTLTVAGVTPGAPAAAIAVVLNVTVTNTSAASVLIAYPAGSTRPVSSNLNWAAGQTIPNLVEAPVGGGGAITIYNRAGLTDVVADLEGYFSAPIGSAGGEVALPSGRITDTRTGSGQPNAGSHLGPGDMLAVQVTGKWLVPPAGVSAAILNVTVTNTTAASALTVWPAGVARPLASNLNWTSGITIANRVFVPVGTEGVVDIFNAAGSADVIVDVSGYFTDGTGLGGPIDPALGPTASFFPQGPHRILDTRSSSKLGPKASRAIQVSGVAGVPSKATAVILNVTVTRTTASSFLRVQATTFAGTLASDLNWVAHQTVANMVVVALGSHGAITFYNGAGSTDVVVDLFGYFAGPATITSATIAAGTRNVIATFSKPVTCPLTAGDASAFTYNESYDGPSVIGSSSGTSITQGTATTCTITFGGGSRVFNNGDFGTLSYTQPASPGDRVTDATDGAGPVVTQEGVSLPSLAAPRLSSTTASSAGLQIVITFDQAINCQSLDADGSDYFADDGTSSFTINITAAACTGPPVNGQSFTVALTYTILALSPMPGDAYTVGAKIGADGNTVDNEYGFNFGDRFEPLPDAVMGTFS